MIDPQERRERLAQKLAAIANPLADGAQYLHLMDQCRAFVDELLDLESAALLDRTEEPSREPDEWDSRRLRAAANALFEWDAFGSNETIDGARAVLDAYFGSPPPQRAEPVAVGQPSESVYVRERLRALLWREAGDILDGAEYDLFVQIFGLGPVTPASEENDG